MNFGKAALKMAKNLFCWTFWCFFLIGEIQLYTNKCFITVKPPAQAIKNKKKLNLFRTRRQQWAGRLENQKKKRFWFDVQCSLPM